MNWSTITTIPRSQKIMLKTASGMQVVGSVRPGVNIQRNKNGTLVIEGMRIGMKNKHRMGSVRVVAWQPLSEEAKNVHIKVRGRPKKAKELKTKIYSYSNNTNKKPSTPPNKLGKKPKATPSLIRLLEQKIEMDRKRLDEQLVVLFLLKKYTESADAYEQS